MTPKQTRFVEEYCSNGGNGTQAAIAAGYSENSADVIASQNLDKLSIKEAISEFRAKTAERAQVTVESLTKQLEDIIHDAGEDGQHGARVSAVSTIAKLHGLLAEDRKNERDSLKEVLNRIDRKNKDKPRLRAVK